MNMKKGFTLVELLAVIVILAIILAIAIPGISNIIDSSKKGAAENDVKMIFKAIDLKKIAEDGFDPTTVTEANIEEKLGINAGNYERITVKEMNGQLYVTMVGQDKWEGITVSGTKTNIKSDETVTAEGANAPVLAAGMIPVKWYENGEEKYWITTTEADSDWYEYGTTPTTRRWANTIQVTNESREEYLTPNTIVDIENDVLAMWVWIPRYVYKIRPISEGDTNSGWHKSTAGIIDIQFSKGVDDSWNGSIDLRETAYASKATGIDNNGNKYTNHPAFTFGDTELTGFWVTKFEPNVDGTTCYTTPNQTNCNLTSLTPSFLPNKKAWRYAKPGTYFTVGRNMETNSIYGWGNTGNGIDTHMIKNVEWGAVAYLSQSTYGKNDEVWINPSTEFRTGCAGDSASAVSNHPCRYSYETANGQQASTTGNVYGIYDMSGNAEEFTAAYLNNNNGDLNNNGASIVGSSDKYKDVYSVGVTDNQANNFATTINKKGDAIYETIGVINSWTGAWYSNHAYMASKTCPWFWRGGSTGEDDGADIFAINYAEGNFENGAWNTSRFIIVVGQGL